MQIVAHGDLVIKAFFVFLAMMLFVSGYMFLVKAVELLGRMRHAGKFLFRVEGLDSLQQARALVGERHASEPFVRTTRKVIVEEASSNDKAPACVHQAGSDRGSLRDLIAQQADEQAAALQRGLEILVTISWLAPLTALCATVWHVGSGWLQPYAVDWAASSVLIQLGLIVATFAWVGYLFLSLAHCLYLSRFARLEDKLSVILGCARQEEDSRSASNPPSGRECRERWALKFRSHATAGTGH